MCDRGQERYLVITTLKDDSSLTVLTVSSGDTGERISFFKKEYLQPKIENTAGYKCWTILFVIMFCL